MAHFWDLPFPSATTSPRAGSKRSTLMLDIPWTPEPKRLRLYDSFERTLVQPNHSLNAALFDRGAQAYARSTLSSDEHLSTQWHAFQNATASIGSTPSLSMSSPETPLSVENALQRRYSTANHDRLPDCLTDEQSMPHYPYDDQPSFPCSFLTDSQPYSSPCQVPGILCNEKDCPPDGILACDLTFTLPQVQYPQLQTCTNDGCPVDESRRDCYSTDGSCFPCFDDCEEPPCLEPHADFLACGGGFEDWNPGSQETMFDFRVRDDPGDDDSAQRFEDDMPHFDKAQFDSSLQELREHMGNSGQGPHIEPCFLVDDSADLKHDGSSLNHKDCHPSCSPAKIPQTALLPGPSAPLGMIPLQALSETSALAHQCKWRTDHHASETNMSSVCNLRFADAGALDEHIRSIHTNNTGRDVDGQLHCVWVGCTQRFPGKPKLDRHHLVHTGYAQFECGWHNRKTGEICDVRMKTKDAIAKHRRTHSGEKPYKCTICARRFATATEKRTHEELHNGGKPHKCPWPGCERAFADSSNLSKHKKIHMPAMYRCLQPGCGTTMKRWDQIYRHFSQLGHMQHLVVPLGLIRDETGKRKIKDKAMAQPILDAQKKYKAEMASDFEEVAGPDWNGFSGAEHLMDERESSLEEDIDDGVVDAISRSNFPRSEHESR